MFEIRYNMQIFNFAIEYISQKRKVRETVLACSHGVQIECCKQKYDPRITRKASLSLQVKLTVLIFIQKDVKLIFFHQEPECLQL